MPDIYIHPKNAVFSQIQCDDGIMRELSEYFKFKVPNCHFMPSYRMKIWDGFIRLFQMMDGTLYSGLCPYLKIFCENRNYSLDSDESVFSTYNISIDDTKKFYKDLNLNIEPRDYQISALHHAIKYHKALLVSPTASGKSLIIYGLSRYYNKKTLIIVPTISLVHQMYSDFEDYSKNDSYSIEKNTHKIFQGQDKETKKNVVISTWQSLQKLPKEWFQQFEVVIVDECHLAKADAIKSILTKLTNAHYRFGFTGTLDGTQTHKMVLEGLLGKVFQVTTTKTLMDKKSLAQLNIKCLVLKYTEEECKLLKNQKYHDEIKFLIENNKRNKMIRNLTISMEGNTLVLFQFVDNHGKVLYELIKNKLQKTNPKRKVFFIHGGTEGEVREEIRKITEKQKNAIIVASSGVFSTGVNIKNLENIIFASPTKSRIRTLQSIGRALRIGRSDSATLYDIIDDLSHKSYKNFALKHFLERVKIYNSEKFTYKIYNITLSKSNTQ